MSLQFIADQLDEILVEIRDITSGLLINHKQTVVLTGLSDITEKLGLIKSGEFRVGNSKLPGDGFTGMRMGYPGFVYEGETWHLAGLNSDALQVGIRATDGKLLAGAGAVVLDEDGITMIGGTGGQDDQSTIEWVNAGGDSLLDFTSYDTNPALDFGVALITANPDGDLDLGSRILITATDGLGVAETAVLKIESLNSAQKFEFTGASIFNAFLETENVFNEYGNDINFRVETSGQVNALFIERSSGKVGIGTASPLLPLHVKGQGGMRFEQTGNYPRET